jgi:hypothetical protein
MTLSLSRNIKLEVLESLICDFISILTCFIKEKIKKNFSQALDEFKHTVKGLTYASKWLSAYKQGWKSLICDFILISKIFVTEKN